MKLIYKGPFVEGVELNLPDGGAAIVAPGESIEVPDDLGRSLLEQADNWAPAKAAPKKEE